MCVCPALDAVLFASPVVQGFDVWSESGECHQRPPTPMTDIEDRMHLQYTNCVGDTRRLMVRSPKSGHYHLSMQCPTRISRLSWVLSFFACSSREIGLGKCISLCRRPRFNVRHALKRVCLMELVAEGMREGRVKERMEMRRWHLSETK
jgi:hypothetical protein